MKSRLEYYLFLVIGHLSSIGGVKSVRIVSTILAYLFFYILKIRKNVVLANLKKAFPELSNKQIKSLALKNYKNFGITFLEMFALKKMQKNEILKISSTDGYEFIENKYKLNKGLILLTAHFGSWEVAAFTTSIYLKESVYVLAKKQSNKYVTRWITDFREQFGNKQITLGTSVRELYKAIKNKKVVGIVGDQRGKRDGIRVKFFGQPTSTFPGTASIALKTGCPVVLLFAARQNDGSYKPIIRELDYSNYNGSREEKVKQFNQAYMDFLEETIRKYPDQWFWMHNIWKY